MIKFPMGDIQLIITVHKRGWEATMLLKRKFNMSAQYDILLTTFY
jgi:hypothetical protein